MPATRWLDTIERVTSDRPPMCPWRAFIDPIVGDVMRVYRFMESGQLKLVIGEHPPAILLEAIGVYHAALMRAQSDAMKRRNATPPTQGG